MMYSSLATADPANRQTNSSAPLFTMVYRSHAATPLGPAELQQLTRAAQARNQREAITGVLVYDQRRFVQWLEGPLDGLERVMRSIRDDPRHGEVEVLEHRSAATRRFGSWHMMLATPGATMPPWQGEAIEPPPAVIEHLARRPDALPGLLAGLAVLPARAAAATTAGALDGVVLSRTTATVLKTVIRQTVIPRLLHQHGLAGRPGDAPAPLPHARAAELAELLVAPDQAAALDLIRDLRGPDGDLSQLYAPLFEPAARGLGDLWDDDLCSEFDVTLGLCRMQSAVRLLGLDAPRAILHGPQPHVLVAPVPGELHHLVAAMDSEWLWHAGWSPEAAFPADDRALEELVAGTWVDVLDLSLSAAFRRRDRLQRLTATIAQARGASRNPALVVLVGGRAFAEGGATGLEVGADLASNTSRNLDRVMLRRIAQDAVRSGLA